MKWLDDHGFEAVTLDQVEDAWYEQRRAPAEAVVLSFDDGYLSQYVAAFPALQHLDWPGVLNLVTKGRRPAGRRRAEDAGRRPAGSSPRTRSITST